jgi:hypothetical protein
MNENPYESPLAPEAKTPQSRSGLVSGVIGSAVVGVMTWLGLIAAAAAFGSLTSLYTGQSSELPKWNGWSHFVFCAKDGAMFGFVLTWPIAVIVFLVGAVRSWQRAMRDTSNQGPANGKIQP